MGDPTANYRKPGREPMESAHKMYVWVGALIVAGILVISAGLALPLGINAHSQQRTEVQELAQCARMALQAQAVCVDVVSHQ